MAIEVNNILFQVFERELRKFGFPGERINKKSAGRVIITLFLA